MIKDLLCYATNVNIHTYYIYLSATFHITRLPTPKTVPGPDSRIVSQELKCLDTNLEPNIDRNHPNKHQQA